MPAALEMLRPMVGINSFTVNLNGVNQLSRFTAECFAPLGFTAEHVPSTNKDWGDHLVLTRRGRSGRSIALVSHLDTVFPPEEEARNNFRWQLEGDRIFGPGTHDIKGGSVMNVARAGSAPVPGAQSLRGHHVEADLELLRGVLLAGLRRRMPRPLRPRHAGRAGLRVRGARGQGEPDGRGAQRPGHLAGHGWWPWFSRGGGKHEHGANAIVQLGQTVQRIAALTDYARGLTVNVATICGGTVLNRVPHEAVVEGEFRTFAREAFAHAKARLFALAGRGDVRSPADGYTCEVKVEMLTECRPWPRNPGTDGLYKLWK
jgi:glutamate carboxypeptidase